VKIRETYKKAMMTVIALGLVFLTVMLAYTCVLAIGVYGISSVIALGIYRWLILGGGMVILIIVYVVRNFMIEMNWKVLVMGVLPLPVFFMKIIMGWMVLYVVMYYRMLVIVNSNGS